MSLTSSFDPSGTGPELSIVVPVYRSEGCLGPLMDAVLQSLSPGGLRFEVILVNDCSPDRSWAVIEELCRTHAEVIGVDLRRNFGQDNAILTGLRYARGRFIAVMDDDLQHHPRYLPVLLSGLTAEYDIVYADFRVKHQKLWKNLGSWFNGKVAEWLLNIPRSFYLSPYKLMRREIGELICSYTGPDPYIDELIFRVTTRVTRVEVEHLPRVAGASTYTLWKCVQVWARLAFSSSLSPLRIITTAGIVTALLGAALGVSATASALIGSSAAPTSRGQDFWRAAQVFLSGIHLVFLGVLGEYVGRTYRAVRGTPQAVVRETRNAGPHRPELSDTPARGRTAS